MRHGAGEGHRSLEPQSPRVFLQGPPHGPVADEEQVDRAVLTMQSSECLEQAIDSVPDLEATCKPDDEPAVEPQPAAQRDLLALCRLEQPGVDRVRQQADLFGRHAGPREVPLQRPRHRDQQVRATPDAPLGPACERRGGEPLAVALFFVGERGVHLQHERDRPLPRQALSGRSPQAVALIHEARLQARRASLHDPGECPVMQRLYDVAAPAGASAQPSVAGGDAATQRLVPPGQRRSDDACPRRGFERVRRAHLGADHEHLVPQLRQRPNQRPDVNGRALQAGQIDALVEAQVHDLHCT